MNYKSNLFKGNIIEMPEGYSTFVLKMESGNRLSEMSESRAHLVKRAAKVGLCL